MLWGEYPALVDASSQDLVRGVVCKIKSEEEVNRLEAYETHMYYRSGFIVYCTAGRWSKDMGGNVRLGR
jgi:hypothetical protein